MFDEFFTEVIGGQGQYKNIPRFNLTFDLNYDGLLTISDWWWLVCYIGNFPIDLFKFILGGNDNVYYTFWGGIGSLLIYVGVFSLVEALGSNIFSEKKKKIYEGVTGLFALFILCLIFIIMPIFVLLY